MQAASRESYAAAAERLDAYVRGAEPSAAGRHRRRDPLRRPACCGASRGCAGRCPTRPARRRTAAALLGDAARRQGRRRTRSTLLAALVAGRWSAPVRAARRRRAAGRGGAAGQRRAAGDLAEVEDELFRFGQVVDGDPQLAATLGRPDRRRPRSGPSWSATLLDGKASRSPSGWPSWRWPGSAGAASPASLTRLVELAAERRDRQVAYVTVAAPLTDERGAPAGRQLARALRSRGRPEGRRSTRRSSAALSVRVGSRPLRRHRPAPPHQARNALAKR